MASDKLDENAKAGGGVGAASAAASMTMHERLLKLLLCVAGIMVCFLMYGVLQERLMTTEYAPGEVFKDSAFLVLCNRVVAILLALSMLSIRRESFRPSVPIVNYAAVSVCNFIATYCQYDALKYVSFPTQTLGKCGKMIPVLLIGSVLYRKSYGWRDYLVAAILIGGCVMFLMTGEISNTKAAKHDTSYGLTLMVFYLLSDGFTSTLQEKLFEGHVSTYNQMLYVNGVSALFSIFALVPEGRIFKSIEFSIAYPSMLLDAFMLSLAAAFGQIVILYTIKTFGALMFSTIMTIRQFLSLLLSSIIFLHPLTFGQWTGATIVFGVLYYKEAFMKSHKKANIPSKSDLEENSKN